MLLALASYEAYRHTSEWEAPNDAAIGNASPPVDETYRSLIASTVALLNGLVRRRLADLAQARARFTATVESAASQLSVARGHTTLPELQPWPETAYVLIVNAALRYLAALSLRQHFARELLAAGALETLLALAREAVFYGQHALITVVLRHIVEVVRFSRALARMAGVPCVV